MHVPGSPYLHLILASLFWSINFVIGRAVHTSVPPLGLAFWRWAFALLILLPFAYPHLRTEWNLVRLYWKRLAVYGLLGVSCFNTFIYISLQTTTATNALLINSTIPVLIVAFSSAFGIARLTCKQAVGVMISFCGVITIICRADLQRLLELQVNSGDIWVLAAAVCWAFYTIMLRHRPEGLHPFSFMTTIIFFGLSALTPFYFWEVAQGRLIIAGPVAIGGILYVALFASVLAFVLWNQAVARIGANKSGLFLHLMPVFGTVLSVVFLGESFYWFQVTGISMIFTGIFLSSQT